MTGLADRDEAYFERVIPLLKLNTYESLSNVLEAAQAKEKRAMCKLIYKARKGRHGHFIVKAVRHSERQAAKLFCRRWARGIEAE